MENFKIQCSKTKYITKVMAFPDPSSSLLIEGFLSFDVLPESGVSLSSFKLNFRGTSEERYFLAKPSGNGSLQLHKDIKLGKKVFFEEEGQIIFMFHGGNVSTEKELQKGPHLFSFLLRVPHELPPSQDNSFQSVDYELVLSCLESSPKSWFKSSRTWNARQEVLIHAHPTKDPMNETNLLDLRLFPLAPLPEALEVVARGQVPNARLGGCFDLSIKFTLQDSENQDDSQMNPTSIRIGMLKVILIQLANVKSIHGNLRSSDQQQVLKYEKADEADPDSALDLQFLDPHSTSTSTISSEQDSGYNSTSNILFDSTTFDEDDLSSLPTSQSQSQSISQFPKSVSNLQTSGFSVDPDSIIKKSNKAYMLTRNVDFSKGGDVIQPSTPKKVRTTVFFEHSIQVEVDLEILNGDSVISKERLILGNEFMLAREDFSTGELQLPSYDDSSSQPPPSTIAS